VNWVCDPEQLDYRFLKFALLAEKASYSRFSHGTTHQTIYFPEVKAFHLCAPAVEVQRAIASALQSLDDKIEQNRRTARALERLARAIFRAWFVDFEPVKAKAAGATSFPSMPQAVFDALPTTFTDSELGPVPEGWEVGTMGDIGVQRREHITPAEIDSTTPYIGLEHMPRREITLGDWGIAEDVTSSKFRFFKGDILFGKLRPYFHKVGPATVDGVCSTDVVVLHAEKPAWTAWLLMLVSSDEFVQHTDQTSAGTKMPRTNWKDMASFRIAIPPEEAACAYEEIAQPMVAMLQQSIHESHSLAALRDYLLPQLLSGQVPVGAA
jgi:type I restriction enzyme S subunit